MIYGFWYVAIGLIALGAILLKLACKIDSNYKKRIEAGGKIYSEDEGTWSWGIALGLGMISFIAALAVLICAVIFPINTKIEYLEFIETQMMVEQVYSSDLSYENVGLTTYIMEANEWLRVARISKKFYGCFSSYCNLDLDSLDYIVLKAG